MTAELLPGMEGEQRSAALSQWYTPPELAVRIVEWALAVYPSPMWASANIQALEPSAGRGALAIPLRQRVRTVGCIELDKDNATYLASLGFGVLHTDFLKFGPYSTGPRYDIAVMNPPFEGGQTERHVLHALGFARRVVCHCPLTTLSGQARYTSLWERVNLHRLAICSTRPKYGEGGGKTDMCTIDVTLKDGEPYIDGTDVEWWP